MRDLMRVRKVMGQALPPPKGVTYTRGTLGGVPGEWVERAGAADIAASPRPTLMYVHGGGFVGCSPRTHRPITAGFALQGFRVFAPDYRLAPEHPFPAPLDDVAAAWRALRTQHDADSPGQRLVARRRERRRQPGPRADAHAARRRRAPARRRRAVLARHRPQRRQPVHRGQRRPRPDVPRPVAGEPGQRVPRPRRRRDEPADLAAVRRPARPAAAADPRRRGRGVARRRPALRREGARRRRARRDDACGPSCRTRGSCWPRCPRRRRSIARASAFLKTAAPDAIEHLDTIIIGAGLSGIGAAVHLQTDFPGRRFAILESRAAIGGTWDLFRYPGVRSDSDMFTLGYAFKPWTDMKSLADGPAIRQLHRRHGGGARPRPPDPLRPQGGARRLVVGRRVLDAGDRARRRGRRSRISCNFLLACSGYYSYAAGHAPEFAGAADFARPPRASAVLARGPGLRRQARRRHRQRRDRRHAGARDGQDGGARDDAAALAHLRAVAAARTTRSPPRCAAGCRACWPTASRAPRTSAWRCCSSSSRGAGPPRCKKNLVGMVRQALGPAHDVDTHFTPKYNPWDQRVCFVPDGDLFEAIKSGSRRGRDRPHRHVHARRHAAAVGPRAARPTSSSRPPA